VRRTASAPPDPVTFVRVAAVSDVPPGTLLSVRLPDGDQVVLANDGGTVHALRDRCSHEEYALSAGELLPDGSIECVWHGARFDCRTGEARRGPAFEDVATYAVRIEGGAVLVAPRRR